MCAQGAKSLYPEPMRPALETARPCCVASDQEPRSAERAKAKVYSRYKRGAEPSGGVVMAGDTSHDNAGLDPVVAEQKTSFRSEVVSWLEL